MGGGPEQTHSSSTSSGSNSRGHSSPSQEVLFWNQAHTTSVIILWTHPCIGFLSFWSHCPSYLTTVSCVFLSSKPPAPNPCSGFVFRLIKMKPKQNRMNTCPILWITVIQLSLTFLQRLEPTWAHNRESLVDCQLKMNLKIWATIIKLACREGSHF